MIFSGSVVQKVLFMSFLNLIFKRDVLVQESDTNQNSINIVFLAHFKTIW